MKKLLYLFVALAMALGTTAAYALTEDFSAGTEFGPMPGWTSVSGWIYNVSDWQVTVNPHNYDNAYTCASSDATGSYRGLTVWDASNFSDVFVECDLYDLTEEIGVLVRGVEQFEGGWDTIGFYVHEWGFEGLGAGYFNWFNPFGQPTGAEEAWVTQGYQNWTPTGAYPHGANRIHVAVTATGKTFRGQAWAYALNELNEETLVATLDTSCTYASDLVVRSGKIGFGSFSDTHMIDNVNAVPEPSSIMALVSGLGCAFAAYRRRRA